MAQRRIAVVGAGLAGLSAGVHLKRAGHHVDLFERSRLLGGKTTSFKVDGVEVDNGQHVFLACCEEFISFVQGLNMPGPSNGDGPLFLQDRFEALLLRKHEAPVNLRSMNLPAPLHLLPALLASRQLGLLGRLQVALALLLLRSSPFPGETFAAWLRRHKQDRAAWVGFWDPFVVPALNAPLDQVSARDAAMVIKTAFLRHRGSARFGYARVPLARIAEHAASCLDEVHLRSPVVGLDLEEQHGDQPPTFRGLRMKDGTVLPYDGAVLALPPERLKSVLSRPALLRVFGLDQFHHTPIVDVHLWFDLPPQTVLGSGFGFAAVLDSPVQWVFEKSAPPGETYLCCSLSAAETHVRKPTVDLVELCLKELRAVLPVLKEASLIRSAATRDPEATFVPSVGLLRPGPVTACPDITLAGAWTATGWPATMESAVKSGRRAAEVLHGARAA